MYPTLAILVLSLLKCAVATVNTSTECVASSSYLAIRKLLQEELQGTTADTGLHLKLDNTLGTDGSLLSAIRSPVSFKGNNECNNHCTKITINSFPIVSNRIFAPFEV